jgi:hypothetical protein
VPLFVDLGRYGDAWLGPALRLTLAVMPDQVVSTSSGSVALRRLAGQLSGCPVHATLWPERLLLRPCLGVEAGVVFAEGRDVAEARSSQHGWAALTATARLQLLPLDWALVELEGGPGLPLVRPVYVVEPTAVLVRVPPVLGTFGGGVGVRFR